MITHFFPRFFLVVLEKNNNGVGLTKYFLCLDLGKGARSRLSGLERVLGFSAIRYSAMFSLLLFKYFIAVLSIKFFSPIASIRLEAEAEEIN